MSFALLRSLRVKLQIFVGLRSLGLNHALHSPLKLTFQRSRPPLEVFEMVSGLAGGDLALSPLLESTSPFPVRQHVVTSAFRSLQRCAPAHTHRVWPPLIFRKRTLRRSSSTFGCTVLPALLQVPIFRRADLIQVPTGQDPPRVVKSSPRSSPFARVVSFLLQRSG